MLPRKERLAREQDIKKTIKSKQYTSSSPLLHLIARENFLAHSRVAVVTPKKLGSAVERNRLRRIFKAAFAGIKEGLFQNLDLVLFPSPEAKSKKTKEIQSALRQGLLRLKTHKHGQNS